MAGHLSDGLPAPLPVTGWQIRRDGQSGWQPVPVPGCWEDSGYPADDPGPFLYRAAPHVPAHFAGRRVWLRFGAVSYDCTVLVNGQQVGRHTGTWDPFEVEIGDVIAPGRPAEVVLRVEKPASPTAGPGSPSRPGRFPLRQTLSGFLPYVWGHAFGGPWQQVTLAAGSACSLADVRVQGCADGEVVVAGECTPPARLRLSIAGPAGERLVDDTVEGGPAFEWAGRLPGPQPWSPDHPALYTLRLELPEGGGRVQRFGLVTPGARGSTLLLNGRPIYPRLALSWGWYPDRRCPNPGPERVRADLLRLRALGYNGVKLCLWFPPSYYFDLADELGMLLWLELPLWLPESSPFFQQQTPAEYERLVCLARAHPSVVLYTLGCELNRAVDASFLAELYRRVKGLAAPALVRDNSGSGEAYGGWLAESADFYDHHFYCELQLLRPLLDAFHPGWRPVQPWLMGEFCDYDTVRDWPALAAAGQGLPWWAQADECANPQGARWEMRAAGQAERLRAGALWARLPELVQASHRQMLLHRKTTLETVRARPELSGYVVTGEADTPISTAGQWDDLGRDKTDPAAYRAFNDDVVLLLGRDRQRTWSAGGDRPLHSDPHSRRAGLLLRAHLLVSNFGGVEGPAHVEWRFAFPGEPPLATGRLDVEWLPAGIRELAVVELPAPAVDHPRRLELSAGLRAGGRSQSNAWPFWIYPARPWPGVAPFGLLDPGGVLADLPAVAGDLCRPVRPGGRLARRVLVCTAWNPAVDRWVRAGGRALVLQQRHGTPGPLPVVDCPYWREALKLAVPHPAWGDFPHEAEPGLQFYALAPDCALDASGLALPWSPLLRRLDTRGLDWTEYALALEWGRGCVVVTTLRLQGGLGDQPDGLAHSPAARHLLGCWLGYLGAARAGERP